jgi:hypothetical protein
MRTCAKLYAFSATLAMLRITSRISSWRMETPSDHAADLPARVTQWIAGGETYEVEFKGEQRERLNDSDLVEAVVCLANGTGGVLLVGVEDEGAVTSKVRTSWSWRCRIAARSGNDERHLRPAGHRWRRSADLCAVPRP